MKIKLSSSWRRLFSYLSQRKARDFLSLITRTLFWCLTHSWEGQKISELQPYSRQQLRLLSVYVPDNLKVNRTATQVLKGKFQKRYATEIASQVDKVVDVYAIDISTKLSVMKPVHAHCMACWSFWPCT